jgi:maltose alpha-D-glucosyltransferase/alpha-amylase
MSADKPLIRVQSFEKVFDEPACREIERAFPRFIQNQRWFRAKTKTIRATSIRDVIRVSGDAIVGIIRVEYADNEHEEYFLPLAIERAQSEWDQAQILARVEDGNGEQRVLYNSLEDPKFRAYLLESIACDRRLGGKGALISRHTEALDLSCQPQFHELKSKISRAEQSNSSVIFEDKYILKLFRKLESGINPDIEIGGFLTRRGFAHTPPVLGELLYETASCDQIYAGILQKYVPNQGDAWKHALDSIVGFFARASQNGNPPELESYDAFVLMSNNLPAVARQTIGEYIESARLLGTRTAEMHQALSSDATDPDFAPEPFTAPYAEILYGEMISEADHTFPLLRQKLSDLPADAEKLIGREQAVRDRFASFKRSAVEAARIRHHGDYHLGQVLFTGDDFIIIDFEGEPARPLAARRTKTLAMRDVAGMLRSFSYAAYAGLFALPDKAGAEGWAAFWAAWVGAEYLKAYFEKARGSLFIDPNPDTQKLLLDVFLLQKAIYETRYELNNRPDWIQIPLRGILSLIN